MLATKGEGESGTWVSLFNNNEMDKKEREFPLSDNDLRSRCE